MAYDLPYCQNKVKVEVKTSTVHYQYQN